MTGFLFAGISNTALADNVSLPDSKTDAQTIGAGNTASGDDWSVEVGSDNNKSVYSVGDKNAISLRDNAVIHISIQTSVIVGISGYLLQFMNIYCSKNLLYLILKVHIHITT